MVGRVAIGDDHLWFNRVWGRSSLTFSGGVPLFKWSEDMKKLLLGVTMGALMSTSALAAEGETITGTVNVDGERECVCELTGFNDAGITFVNFDEMDTFGAADTQSIAELGLFCNLPSEVTLTSTNGYLALNTVNTGYQAVDGDNDDFTTSLAPDFAGGLDYSASISAFGLVGDSGQLAAGTPANLGVIPPQNQSGITVDFDTIPGDYPLIAGDYSDVLVVSITPVSL